MFQTWIAYDATANEVIRWRNMYSCIVQTDCICDQECYKMLTSWIIESTTRFICMKCWLRIFCKLCLSEELNNLINIDRAVTALYSRVELTHSRKAKQWQRDHQRVEACTYTEWQQRLCIHAATHIWHIHIFFLFLQVLHAYAV